MCLHTLVTWLCKACHWRFILHDMVFFFPKQRKKKEMTKQRTGLIDYSHLFSIPTNVVQNAHFNNRNKNKNSILVQIAKLLLS